MAMQLDHAQQGDVATVEADSKITRSVKLMGPQQLYELWERQPWSSREKVIGVELPGVAA